MEDRAELLRIVRQQEDLTGPLRIYAGTEVRNMLDEVNTQHRLFMDEVEVVTRDPNMLASAEKVVSAWDTLMMPVIRRMEDAMRQDVGL